MTFTLRWACVRCKHNGTMEVTPYPGETAEDTARREQRRTRYSCIDGCAYTATPKKQQEREDSEP